MFLGRFFHCLEFPSRGILIDLSKAVEKTVELFGAIALRWVIAVCTFVTRG